MKKLLTLLLLVACWPAAAQNYDLGQDMTIKIWDDKDAPHQNGLKGEEVYQNNVFFNTTSTELFIFKADPAKATGQAIVVIAGGGYGCVCVEWEGYKAAEWLASNGITCGVLKYRLPNGHPEVPLEDAVAALRTMRKMADDLKINKNNIGVMGSSAGGHLAAYVSTLAADEDKPNFTVLFYPVITSEEGRCHKGSFDNLLGANATERERAFYSLETRVTKSTPPALIFYSDGDPLVPSVSGTRYYNALDKHGIKASLHIYPEGWHGWCMHPEYEQYEVWTKVMLDWLKRQK